MSNDTQSRPEAELPELPEPSIHGLKDYGGDHYTATQMRAYGQQCAASRPAEVGGDGWLPIESAPKNKEVLVWREDCGVLIAKLTTPDAVIPESQLEEMEFADDFEEWWSDAYGWHEGSERPTHWMEKPEGPAPGSEVRP